MVVGVAAVFVEAMGRHELDHLQSAFRAVDVRNLDVGFLVLIGGRPDWKICGEAATGNEASNKAKKLSPDMVLLDLTMPEMDGLEAIPRILDACLPSLFSSN